MTTPIPALNPVRTGSEMKLATKPRRKTAAATSTTPTSKVSVAAALKSEAGSVPLAASPRAAPVRMASVVDVVTLSGRELPSSA